MSYSRFGENSDVYIYRTRDDCIVCQMCLLNDDGKVSSYFKTPQDALRHLKDHRENGHKVEYGAFKRLKSEIK